MAESAQFAPPRPPKRKVVVLNIHQTKDYTEQFKGETITVKANRDRSLVMDLLTAEKFLSSVGQTMYEVDAAGREISMGKPLKIEELTDDEKAKFDPIAAKQDDKNLCTLCGETLPTVKGLKLHLQRKHPGFEPIKE